MVKATITAISVAAAMSAGGFFAVRALDLGEAANDPGERTQPGAAAAEIPAGMMTPPPSVKRAIDEGYTPEEARDFNRLETMARDEKLEEIYRQDQSWRNETEFAGFPSTLAQMESEVRKALRDPSSVLTLAQERDLTGAISRFYWLRAQHSPDAYIDWLERTPSVHWNQELPSSLHAAIFLGIFDEHPGPWPTDPEDLARLIWERMSARDHFPARMGTAGLGLTAVALRVRTAQQLNSQGLSGKDTISNPEWYGGHSNRYGIALGRDSGPSLEAVIERDEHAIAAACHMIVQLGDGRVTDWITTWYHDPESDRWITHFSQTSGTYDAFSIW